MIPKVALVDGDAQSVFAPHQGAEVAVGERNTAMGAFKRK